MLHTVSQHKLAYARPIRNKCTVLCAQTAVVAAACCSQQLNCKDTATATLVVDICQSAYHSATFMSICSLTSDLISPVSPANSARKPCCLLLITSISCKLTTCTTCNARSAHQEQQHVISIHYQSKCSALAKLRVHLFNSTTATTACSSILVAQQWQYATNELHENSTKLTQSCICT
jgi:hypothetical protein